MRTITCEDCGQPRSNAQFKNTRYCHSDRLLRDLIYVGDELRPCADCKTPFAPVNRKDRLCGRCNYGSIYEGHCKFCDSPHAELHRPTIAACTRCVRDPDQRRRIISGLKNGQRARRQANNHAATKES